MADDDPTPSWRPAVADVAALIRARTKIPGGVEAGTFQDERVADPDADPPVTAQRATRPNATEVEALIDQACRRVASRIGGPTICSDASDLEDDAKSAAAMYAAMLVEQSYWPEQTTAAGSSFQSLRSLWADTIKDLAEGVESRCGTGTGGDGVASTEPSSYFDDAQLIGRSGPCW